MTLDRKLFRALPFALLPAFAGGLDAQQPPPHIVALSLAQNGGDLPSSQRDAVEAAILSMAKAADIVLCQEGQPSVAHPDLTALCSQADLPRLWWKAHIEVPREGDLDLLSVSLELQAGAKAPTGPAQLLVLSQKPLSAAEKDADPMLAEQITASLATLPNLQSWFGDLRQRQDLRRPWPARKAAATAPAKAPADEKAAEPRKKIEIEESAFLVREALVGGGFSQGVSGSLRITKAGVGFTPKGSSREAWSIPWRDLTDASKDAGLWDISHALVLTDRKGSKRYIARIDEKGSYQPGDAILAAIRQKRSSKAGKAAEP